MNNLRYLLIGAAMVFATVAAGKEAHAQRRMVVLIDASGSMTLTREGDTTNPTRFHAARALARQRISEEQAAGTNLVSVYTFQDTSASQITAGFVTADQARADILGLDPVTTPFGNTPLAGSICDAVDALVLSGATTRILQVSSDGEENFTPDTHQCAGPFSTFPEEPFSDGSWQNKVLNYAIDNNITVRIDLFNNDPIVNPFMARSSRVFNPEASITAKAKATGIASKAAGALADERPPTLVEFFSVLARETGGRLVVAEDAAPLPVFADMNADRCVDRSDALLLARQFGLTTPPADGKFDLSGDGKIGFADYQILLANRTAGCSPDPYVARAPLVCTNRTVTIDGQAVEGGGITIEARGACNVVIRNSLVVAGQNAINIIGGAVITVDNSILVGENAVISTRGAAFLSAANTVFHGKRELQGALVFIDRGGNTWEQQ